MKSATITVVTGLFVLAASAAARAVNIDVFHPHVFTDMGLPIADTLLGDGLWLIGGPMAAYGAFRSLHKLNQELNDAQHPGDYSHKATTGTISTAIIASSAAVYTFFGQSALKGAGLTYHLLAHAPVIHHLVR